MPNYRILFARTFQFTFQNIDYYDTYDAGEKDKTM